MAWGGALAGVLFRVLWSGAPRWLYVPVYVGLGWAAVFYVDEFAAGHQRGRADPDRGRRGALLPRRRGLRAAAPRPVPSWFGFHEVFHTLTILAFITHYVGLSLATYSLR